MCNLILLFMLFFTATNVICSSFTNGVTPNDDEPFWINPCGYSLTNNDDYDDSDAGIMNRILTLANICQSNIDAFKSDYIKHIFNINYSTHYQRWVNMNNDWMTPRLLKNAEDNFSSSWMIKRLFPNELSISYQILQRVFVGFEMLLQDASTIGNLENKFLNNFLACKDDLQQLLCEISDDIDFKSQEKPVDVSRNIIPDEVRQETSTAKRNLTNSIIFRDYMIAIKYITSTYGYLSKSDFYISIWHLINQIARE